MKYCELFINYLQATKNLSMKSLNAYRYDLYQFQAHETNECSPNICAYISYLKLDLKLKEEFCFQGAQELGLLRNQHAPHL